MVSLLQQFVHCSKNSNIYNIKGTENILFEIMKEMLGI